MDKQPAITIDQNKNVTINAQGTLNILGSGKPSSQGNAIAYAYVGAILFLYRTGSRLLQVLRLRGIQVTDCLCLIEDLAQPPWMFM